MNADYFEQRIRARWPFVLAACLTLVLLLGVVSCASVKPPTLADQVKACADSGGSPLIAFPSRVVTCLRGAP